MDAQFSIGCSINGRLFQDQFPQPVLLCDGQDIVIVQDVLGGRDDLQTVCRGFE